MGDLIKTFGFLIPRGQTLTGLQFAALIEKCYSSEQARYYAAVARRCYSASFENKGTYHMEYARNWAHKWG